MPARTAPVMRDHSVHERASTPLELLFDLCFVVAVSFLAAELHHGVAGGHPGEAIAAYLMLFIPIWWAWMSYSWYATAFSHDDPVHRLLTGAQMLGVLGVAATIPGATRGELLPFSLAYGVMRLPLIAQWVRSAIADPPHRGFALTYAAGSVLAQVLWVVGAALPHVAGAAVFALALGVELTTPVLAVRRSPDRVFHPGHIAERYGLFTIIVLGESILAITVGLRAAVEASTIGPGVLVAVTATLVVAFAVWWLYFDTLGAAALVRNRQAAFAWGYGHYLIFAGIAAVGASTGVALDALTDPAHADPASGSAGARLLAGALAVVFVVLLVLARLSRPVPAGPLSAGAAACLVLAGAAPNLGVVWTFGLVAAVAVVVGAVHRTWGQQLAATPGA